MEILYAKDNPEFMKVFDPEINDHIDLETLRLDSMQWFLYVIDESDGEVAVGISSVRAFYPPDRPMPFMRAMDMDGFMDNYHPELNPGVDVEKLYAGSRKKILYPDRFGRIRQRSIYDIVNAKEQYHPVADDECYGIIGNSSLFWGYCIEDDKEKISQTLRTNRVELMRMQCPTCGKIFKAHPKDIFTKEEPCPFCARNAIKREENRRFEGNVDDIDPYVREYWSDENELTIDEIALTSPKKYKWQCIMCGHKFEKAPIFVVKKSPKCPLCKDRGLAELFSFRRLNDDNIYLERTREREYGGKGQDETDDT